MENPALTDKLSVPTDEVLARTLQASHPAFIRWRELLAAEGVGLEWRYYADGKAWLGKMLCGTRNLGWLVPFAGYFRTDFYFPARAAVAIAASELPETVKAEFAAKDFTQAKLHPLSFRIATADDTAGALAALRLKRTLK